MTFTVSPAPHIHRRESTASLMLDVIIALTPCAIAGVCLFGWNAARVLLLSAAFCVLLELGWQKLMKKPVRLKDLSALVTGLILGLNLPPTAPWWMILVGSGVAILLVKQLFGGLGHNFLNPALAARAVLLTSWPAHMTASNTASAFINPVDGVSSATLLTQGTTLTGVTAMEKFLGQIPGCIGEVSKLAILIGLVYLLIRRVYSWHVPVIMAGSFALCMYLFGDATPAGVLDALLSGGVLFGAVFMATDYVTNPMTTKGRCVFAFGCGLITALIRSFGSYPEGVTYAILLMNIVTPLIDRSMKPRLYGNYKNPPEVKAP